MLVGAVQVGTYDQFRQMYRQIGIKHEFLTVFYASMTSGLIYSIVTMPFETAKNRMVINKLYFPNRAQFIPVDYRHIYLVFRHFKKLIQLLVF